MKIVPFTLQEQAKCGFSHRIILTYADLLDKTSATAFAIYPALSSTVSLPKGFSVQRACLNVKTAAVSSGGAITTLTGSVGDTASGTRYVNAADLKTVDTFAGAVTNLPFFHTNATDNIKFTATIAGQTLASLTALEVHILLFLADLNILEN